MVLIHMPNRPLTVLTPAVMSIEDLHGAVTLVQILASVSCNPSPLLVDVIWACSDVPQ